MPPTADANPTSDVILSEIASAVKTLKSGKAPDSDKLHPEFFLNMHPNCLAWLASLFSTCLKEKAIPSSGVKLKSWPYSNLTSHPTHQPPIDLSVSCALLSNFWRD